MTKTSHWRTSVDPRPFGSHLWLQHKLFVQKTVEKRLKKTKKRLVFESFLQKSLFVSFCALKQDQFRLQSCVEVSYSPKDGRCFVDPRQHDTQTHDEIPAHPKCFSLNTFIFTIFEAVSKPRKVEKKKVSKVNQVKFQKLIKSSFKSWANVPSIFLSLVIDSSISSTSSIFLDQRRTERTAPAKMLQQMENT